MKAARLFNNGKRLAAASPLNTTLKEMSGYSIGISK